MIVTPIYAALFGFILVVLQWRITNLRGKFQTARMQEEGHSDMAAATRAVGNLVEYIPLALILMALAEAQETAYALLHLLGVTLLAARVIHLKGLKDPSGKSPWRKLGTRLTWTAIAVNGVICLAASFGYVI
jgi:uncharacterized membrane protein YecN with MAPEG domain